MKRILSIALALCMALSLFMVSAHAASDEMKDAAEKLHELGLLRGSGMNADGSIDYDLDSALTRDYGVTMFVRVLGKEVEAKAGTWEHPFVDVPEWLNPYVGYAYAKHLTNGVGKDANGNELFGSKTAMTATQYLTFILRALGYASGTDFAWDAAWELTDKLGITSGEYGAANNDRFTRGDMALVSLAAQDAALPSWDGIWEMEIPDRPTTADDYSYFKFDLAGLRAYWNISYADLLDEGEAYVQTYDYELRIIDDRTVEFKQPQYPSGEYTDFTDRCVLNPDGTITRSELDEPWRTWTLRKADAKIEF